VRWITIDPLTCMPPIAKSSHVSSRASVAVTRSKRRRPLVRDLHTSFDSIAATESVTRRLPATDADQPPDVLPFLQAFTRFPKH
jgi:hypothetical protein